MSKERQDSASRRLILGLVAVLLAFVVFTSVFFVSWDLVGGESESSTPPPVPTIAPATPAP